MPDGINIPDVITQEVTFTWNDRTWISVSDAMPIEEMRRHLSQGYGLFLSDASEYASRGGTFDVTGSRSFKTYYVHKQMADFRRLFRATDIRELKDGQVW